MNKLIRICMYFCIAGLLLWLLPAIFLVQIGPHEIGVRQSNVSGVNKEDLEPGWHWRIPGMHKVITLPSTYYFLDYTPDDIGPQGPLQIRTKDNNIVHLDVSVPVRILQGHANELVSDGNHVAGSDGRHRYQRLAEETTVSVLREQLAELDSVGFYTTEQRLAVSEQTLKILNEALEPLHLQAESVLIRAVRFRGEYENQLQRIQLNEQEKLLDQAREKVADQQQELDNYQQGTNAQAAAREQDWIKKKAELERRYQVGFVDVAGDNTPGAARRQLAALTDEERNAVVQQAIAVFGLEAPEEISPEYAAEISHYLLGIKNIEAETREYAQRVSTEAKGIAARLQAEGEAKLATVRGQFESRLNALLSSPAGRAYVAWKSAEKVSFDKNLTFNSSDGIPSVLRLRRFAQQFMGDR